MELIKQGKTKDIYKNNNYYVLKFKDEITGLPDGSADPGGNQVIGSIKGMGSLCLRTTDYLFKLFEKDLNIKSHLVSTDLENNTATVKPANIFGYGIEVIVRFYAFGSFVKRFGAYVNNGEKLKNPIIEITLKDDLRQDPPISDQILTELNIISKEHLKEIYENTLKIANYLDAFFSRKSLALYDFKIEFGLNDDKVILMDELSPGSMRLFKSSQKLNEKEIYEAIVN